MDPVGGPGLATHNTTMDPTLNTDSVNDADS
jgi:hypothetical protein